MRAHSYDELNAAADRLADLGHLIPPEDELFRETAREKGLQYAAWSDLAAPVPTAQDAQERGLPI